MRIDVVSAYFKEDALLWYKVRERLLDLGGSQDSWKAFSSKLEERFTNKQEIAKDNKRILALKFEGSCHGNDLQTTMDAHSVS